MTGHCYSGEEEKTNSDFTRGGICRNKKISVIRENDERNRHYFIQSSLNLLGYYTGKIDGLNGKITKQAINAFQIDNKINPTGSITIQTKVALISMLAEHTI